MVIMVRMVVMVVMVVMVLMVLMVVCGINTNRQNTNFWYHFVGILYFWFEEMDTVL